MILKEYQSNALETFSEYLKLLQARTTAAETMAARLAAMSPEDRQLFQTAARADPLEEAWADASQLGAAAGAWNSLVDGTGKSVPNVCLKVPTGGGKTLMAAHAVAALQTQWLKRLHGLVLWIVPSQAIYSQALAALRNRSHPIRQTLDQASGGRTLILEKTNTFSRQDVEDRLCVIVLMLQAARREDEKVLKMFRGGGSASFFPDETDKAAIDALRGDVPNLDAYDLAEGATPGSIKRTLANVIRIERPLVVLDEAHNAVTELGRRTLATLNPSFILELTATPTARSNVLVDVTGKQLRDEQMIKLPINVAVDVKKRWEETLRASVDQLNALTELADEHRNGTNSYIRPILIVRVDFTGDKTRDRPIHVEDAVEWLVQHGGISIDAIRRQTADKKELGDDDLMSPRSDVRVIVTKDALREGWDCPFAYVLAILSSGKGATALTQFIGRVLRQPYAARTNVSRPGVSLDEAYVFCTDANVGAAVKKINKGLEGEGMGDLASSIRTRTLGDGGTDRPPQITIKRPPTFTGRRVLLPSVLHADASAPSGWRDLDYEADLLAQVPWDDLVWDGADEYEIAPDHAARMHVQVDLNEEGAVAEPLPVEEDQAATAAGLDAIDLTRRLSELVPNPWQAHRIVDQALNSLRQRGISEDQLIAGRLTLLDTITRDLREKISEEAKRIFRQKVTDRAILFKLVEPPVPLELREVASSDGGALTRADLTPLQRALYTPVLAAEVNGFEAPVALYLDETEAVGWWWRLAARRDGFGLQGWKPHRVYPDFLISLDEDGHTARLLVLETKGGHLRGNEDTTFKQELFDELERSYAGAQTAGLLEIFEDAPERIRFKMLFANADDGEAWKGPLQSALN